MVDMRPFLLLSSQFTRPIVMSKSPQNSHFQAPLRDQEGWYKPHFEKSTGVPTASWRNDQATEVEGRLEGDEIDLEDGNRTTAVSSFPPQDAPPEAQIDDNEGRHLEPKPEYADRPLDTPHLQNGSENIGVAKATPVLELKDKSAKSTIRGRGRIEIVNTSIGTITGKPVQLLQDEKHAGEDGDSRDLRLIALKNFVLSDFLFRAGTLSYLLFLVKILRKIWTMFQNQISVAVGHLALSVALFILTRYWGTKPALTQVIGKRSRFSHIIVDTMILVGAFICTTIVWLMMSVIGESVVMLRMYF
ncbi:hypothetical protein F5879DRAFT_985311 [Lentinula edodes]|uniref:uncharacterized protein n=1 Tax=Lentinula edodes TaxID=5353 RepID=UPI001E8E8592|nr:uncharacterized protein C8R40DRAFT_1168964 [Lentinula edodes]KAH7877037.1 hypothetical protein C8R40DRAFT_1168964 [Lentinula edodes]KAJ3872953.1 hypothetical protein F5051DRAFT_444699 [Lentinula edodes]KAJ3908732.1 hypothetical protein F5879DRAFT_985311 [Lentinula edodes]